MNIISPVHQWKQDIILIVCVSTLTFACFGFTAFAADIPRYPQYKYSHAVLDLIHSPMVGQEGKGRLPDEFPVNFGREWVPEGVYVDVIRVDNHVDNPLGRYYLYYTIHAHVGCGLAYADNPNGPWTFLDTLLWEDGAAVDVIWLEDSQQFAAYYHPNNRRSVMRFSKDGITWSETQELASGADLYGSTGCFFYTKVYEHTCPSLNNKYIMLWRAEGPDKWANATCLMYSDDGIDWTFHPEPIHHDGPNLGSNFLQWGDTYLLMQWGEGFCVRGFRLIPGGPKVLIYETPADLAHQQGTKTEDDDGYPTCTNTMPLIEAEPGCGYTIDGEDESGGGRGPFEGKHVIEGDTLYHFGMAWNDSCPECWGGNWCCGQVALWKAPIPEGAMPVSVERRRHRAAGIVQTTAPLSVWMYVGTPADMAVKPNETVSLFTLRGRKMGSSIPTEHGNAHDHENATLTARGVIIVKPHPK